MSNMNAPKRARGVLTINGTSAEIEVRYYNARTGEMRIKVMGPVHVPEDQDDKQSGTEAAD